MCTLLTFLWEPVYAATAAANVSRAHCKKKKQDKIINVYGPENVHGRRQGSALILIHRLSNPSQNGCATGIRDVETRVRATTTCKRVTTKKATTKSFFTRLIC